MGKRKYSEEKKEKIKKKIRKLEYKLRRQEEERIGSSEEGTPPPGSPVAEKSPPGSPITEIELNNSDEIIPEDLLGALGPEGQEIIEKGEQIQLQLATRWSKIITEGLEKDSRESILKKYPIPENFPAAVPPEINPEIAASLSDPTLKRDKRIVARQNLLGKLLSSLGRTLTQILRGEINNKKMVEEINDAAKIAADVYHQDTVSRKFFALSNTTAVVRDAIKGKKPDKFLFGADCGENIRAAQTVQKTGNQIKETRKKEGNWRSPLQPHQQPRSGQYHQTQKTRAYNPQPQRRPQYQPRGGHQQQSQKTRVYNPPPQRRTQKPTPQTKQHRR